MLKWSLVMENADEKKTLEELPNDIIENHILPKLPIECLPIFKCFNKSFNAFISSPAFIDGHLRRYTGRLVIVNTNNCGLHVFDFDALERPPYFLPLYEDSNYAKIDMVGSCNGLLCVRINFRFMLINPLTGMSFNVPNVPSSLKRMTGSFRGCMDGFGFGFDDWSKDYKIVKIHEVHAQRFNISVFSLRANSWRSSSSVGVRVSDCSRETDHGALIDNHLLHWLFTFKDPNSDVQTCRIGWIGCFNLRTEEWVGELGLPWVGELGLPPEYDAYLGCHMNCETLTVFDGLLCLLAPTMLNSRLIQVDMWVMKEYGVKESWVKVLGVSDPSVTSSLRMCPLGLNHGSILDPDDSQHEMLLAIGDKYTNVWSKWVALTWCGMKEKEGILSPVHKDHGLPQHFHDVHSCTKSLVPLPGGSWIRKEKGSLVEQHPLPREYGY